MHRDDDGRTKSYHNAAAYTIWKPYGEAFGRVNVVGRVDMSRAQSHGEYVTGPAVGVVPVRFYYGLRRMLVSMPKVMSTVFSLGDRDSIFVGKLPEPISLLLYLRARKLKATFIALVVSEPNQLYRALVPGLAGRLLAGVFSSIMRSCLRNSSAAIYVTQSWLQQLYPVRAGVPTMGYNNIDMDGLLVDRPRRHPSAQEHEFRLVSVGTMETSYKRFDQLLVVLSKLRRQGFSVALTLVGDGRERGGLEARASELGIREHVTFTGHMEHADEVRSVLDEADVFVMASAVEGLPRALIEAMARALPAVSTRAGGVEELLDDDDLVDIGDVEALTRRIARLLADPHEYDRTSTENLSRLRDLAELTTEARLITFLKGVAGSRSSPGSKA
ncbi:glycosyltransferase [Luethyella okanaganae]|uniref:D-inositol 3-phosphate glycosyltransferase n=1 Tax=Luethyella okanaganae TaxID=69372 RepID=A0ABW1VCZ5_9MICO